MNPQNADDVIILNSGFHRSSDGGVTFGGGGGGGGGCGDCHDAWIDPKDGKRFVLTDDGGARITSPTGSLSVSLPNGQMYHVATDNQMPYWVYSNRQDNSTMRGPSNSPVPVANVPSYEVDLGAALPRAAAVASARAVGGALVAAVARLADAGTRPARRRRVRPAPRAAARRVRAHLRRDVGAGAPAPQPAARGGGGGRGGGGSTWQAGIGGCESGFTLPLYTTPDIVWASCYGDEVTRWDARLGRARSVSPWIHTLDSEPPGLKYRCHWTPPLAIDPFDDETVYYGCNVIFKTSDKGQTWQVISPDLSTQDPAHIVSSGGIVGDNLGQFYRELVFAIAPSRIQKGLIWAGTNDGKVWVTKNGGTNWTDSRRTSQGVTPLGTITQISPSEFDPGTAYMSIDTHLVDDRKPYLFKTYGLRRDVDEDQRRPAADASARLHEVGRRGPEQEGHAVRRHGARLLLLDERRRHVDELPERSAARAGHVDHDSEELPRRRHLDVRPWALGDGRHQRARGDGADVGGEPRPRRRCSRRVRACARRASGEAKFLFSLGTAPTEPVKFEIYDSANTLVRSFDATGDTRG